MTPRESFDKTLALVIERWPFPSDAMENDYRRELWRLVQGGAEKNLVELVELTGLRAGDQKQYGRPSPRQLWDAALETCRYGEKAPTLVKKTGDQVAWGLHPDRPWNDPDNLMGGMLAWKEGGTMRQRIIEYLAEYHGIDASHLLHAPRKPIVQKAAEDEGDDPLTRRRSKFMQARTKAVVDAVKDFNEKHRRKQ